MKKLALYTFALSSALSLSACDSGSDSSMAQAANGCATSSAACASALKEAASKVPANPGILANNNAQIPGETATTVAGGQTDASLTNTNTAAPVVTLNQGFSATDILNQKNGLNYENAVSALNKAISTGNKSASAMAGSYTQDQGAEGAK